MNRNFQLGEHPDADQFSVFVEGAASPWERERMLAHLAECEACRKAVFVMQPHEETQPAARTPVKGWIWGRLLPVGLSVAALVCGVIAALIYVRPHGGAPGAAQQIASVRQPEMPLPQTTVAPTAEAEKVAQSGEAKKSLAPNGAASGRSRQENPVAGGLNLPTSLPKSQSYQVAANVAAQPTTAADLPAAASVAGAAGSVSGVTASQVPLAGRNVTNLSALSSPADAKAATSQNSVAKERTQPQLKIAQDSGQADEFAGVSGRITDRSGANIAGARVFLRDAGGKTRQTITSADGSFHLTELPAGRYELIATASGFKTVQQSIQLNPSQLAMLQPVLDVGAASEQVTVEAGAQTVNTEDSSLSQNVDARVLSGNGKGLARSGYARVFWGNGDGHSASQGKLVLSLDSTGNLLLSRNGGKKWKKIRPQWAGKAVRIELTPAYSSEAPPKPKNESLGKATEAAVFVLTTDTGTVWASKDGAHWHQQ